MKSARAQSPSPESSEQSAPRLRIAGVDPELGFGGGETQVLGLTLALAAAGHDAELICDPAGRLWERAAGAGIRCHPLRIRNALDISAAIRLRGILKRERYDIVHFHTSRAHSMAPLVRGFAPALLCHAPHGLSAQSYFRALPVQSRGRWHGSDLGGVADSLAAAGVDRACVSVVPSGVDCARFRPPSADERARARSRFGISEQRIVIAAVGALEPRKGHRNLIEAIAALAQSDVVLKCFIAGDGSMRIGARTPRRRAGVSPGDVAMLGRIEDTRELLWALTYSRCLR